MMKRFADRLDSSMKKAEQFPGIRSIRGGLVTIIPILMIGSFALIFKSLPINAWQSFLATGAGAFFGNIFTAIYTATFGFLSIYMSACVGFFMERNMRGRTSFGYGASLVSVCTFLISVGFLSDGFELISLSASGMFIAILCSTLLSRFYLRLTARLSRRRIFSDGSSPHFSKAVIAIPAILVVVLSFSVLDFLLCFLFRADNLWQLMNHAFISLFSLVGEDFWGGLLYVLISTVMWFFGIHGSDVLESVNTGVFVPAAKANAAAAAAGLPAGHLYTKTFFDVFVLMGGCGTLLCLLLAILLFSRRRSNRTLAKIAAFPMLFNINEIMVFGLPIIYNPILLVPFLSAPLASYLIAAAALKLGLVPFTISSVEWTTPVVIGGYEATGSASGVILQLAILAVGTAIYAPFVRRYDREKDKQAADNLQELVGIYKAHEAAAKEVCLTELEGVPGEVAKQLAADLERAISRGELYFLYQPQYSYSGRLFGAEALLRWKHPQLGLIYPPLIIKLAAEAGLLSALEKYIYTRVGSEISDAADILFSINATAVSLQDDGFIDFLIRTFPGALSGRARICVEMTEQEALSSDAKISERLSRLKENGFRLAIDDFSMGHTSLKYLQEGCFDEVKLDGALTGKVLTDPKARDIISSVVFLSQAMGVTVVAEFVETQEQKEALAKLGCLYYQGYLYSPPVPLSELSALAGRNTGIAVEPGAKPLKVRQTSVRTDFVEQVSRQIRTPLTSIMGLSDLALQKYADPELRGCFEQIKSCSQLLLSDLLNNPDVQNLMLRTRADAAGREERGSTLSAESTGDVVSLAGLRVLLCEDNAMNREIGVALLQNRGVKVDTAENGALGVRMFSEGAAGTYNAILMDIHMPVMGGYEAARAIRALDRPDARSIPILAMTADAFDDDVQKCIGSGMNGHIAKPIDPETLYRALGAAAVERRAGEAREE